MCFDGVSLMHELDKENEILRSLFYTRCLVSDVSTGERKLSLVVDL